MTCTMSEQGLDAMDKCKGKVVSDAYGLCKAGCRCDVGSRRTLYSIRESQGKELERGMNSTLYVSCKLDLNYGM